MVEREGWSGFRVFELQLRSSKCSFPIPHWIRRIFFPDRSGDIVVCEYIFLIGLLHCRKYSTLTGKQVERLLWQVSHTLNGPYSVFFVSRLGLGSSRETSKATDAILGNQQRNIFFQNEVLAKLALLTRSLSDYFLKVFERPLHPKLTWTARLLA